MDLSTDLLPKLHDYRIPGLDLGTDFLYPNYNGFSIQNIPSSICRWLGAPEIGGAPLAESLIAPFADAIFKRVILVVVDALAFERLQRWMLDGATPVWKELAQDGLLAPLTSVTPSTTSAALTTFWTGRSPSEHGLTGYEMWLKEYGLVANTIQQTAISFFNDPGGLERAGFRPEEYLPFPVMGTHLAAGGVQTFAFQHSSITRSGLSRTFFKDTRVRRYHTASDLWVNLRDLLEAKPLQRLYAYAYWAELDTLSHSYGPDDERSAAEFEQFSASFERLFLRRLHPALRQGTLLILTADHGAVMTRPDSYYDLRKHPNFTRRLHIQPTGENRLAYLYIRPGQSEAVREYIERTWPAQFKMIDAAYAVESGLFGPGAPHPGLLERVGDVIVVAKDQAYLWWANKDNLIYGRHGGLHPQEMLVPFLAVGL